MLSRKMGLLWVGIISIFVLAFGVLSAMAAEFGVSLDMSNDASHVSGLQLQDAATITFIIKFDEAVALATEDISVSYFDEAGTFLPASNAPTIFPSTAAKEFRITITPPNGTTKLTVRTRRGIESADVLNDDTSGAGDWDIQLLRENPQGGPDVLKIALAGQPFATITTATFQIHVLLSEEPRGGFSEGLLEITNASVHSVVKLTSPRSSTTVNGRTVSASWRDNRLHLYLVTLETQPGEKTVTIKVKNFAGMETETQETYIRKPDAELIEGKDKLTIKTHAEGLRTVEIIIYLPEDTIPVDVDTITTTEAQKANATPEATTVATVSDTSVMIPMEGRIYISEIMFTGGGRLPQWIEISNGSRTEQVNLSGWTLTVENATGNANAFVNEKAKFRIPEGTRIDPSGQHDTPSTILVVAKKGRNNLDAGPGTMGEDQVVNLNISRPRYALLSDMAFKIRLAPPGRSIVPEQVAARAAATDMVGNLADDGTAMWALPMHEGDGRSSILRRHVSAEPKDGTMMDAWVLASDTGFTQDIHDTTQSYYGFPTDVGTPGFRAGGALPVELSHFRPARQKDTGTVVITWTTASELNNAGFFIKRSQQRDGQFVVVTPTMVPGAGTTSEKQFYTYTDTTAQPNLVYYYQIEDVSFDGQRRMLTGGIRLKGHVGAAGKAAVMWGELKILSEL